MCELDVCCENNKSIYDKMIDETVNKIKNSIWLDAKYQANEQFRKIKELQVQLDEEKSINNKLNAKVQELERKLNTNDNTWEIMCIINHFNDAVKNVDEFSDDYEKLKEKYAQAIRLQCHNYGYIMTREDFIICVKDGSFIDYDGCGVFLDFDGNEHESTRCDVEYLKKFEYPFVAWFNK